MFTRELAIAFWGILAGIPLLTSVAYFRSSRSGTSLAKRIAVSLHGLYIAALHLGVWIIASLGWERPEFGSLFGVLCLLALVPMAYSFLAYQGEKSIHWLQFINAFWLLSLLFLGGMAVTGQWL